MKTFAILVAAIAFATPALALDVGATPDCKTVTIQRPNVTGSPIGVRFKNTRDASADLLTAINQCNNKDAQSGFVRADKDPAGGVKVFFAATIGAIGSGKILLPISLTDGSVDQVVCAMPVAPSTVPTHQKYATAWSGALQDTITLQKLDNYDKVAADAGCAAALPAKVQN